MYCMDFESDPEVAGLLNVINIIEQTETYRQTVQLKKRKHEVRMFLLRTAVYRLRCMLAQVLSSSSNYFSKLRCTVPWVLISGYPKPLRPNHCDVVPTNP